MVNQNRQKHSILTVLLGVIAVSMVPSIGHAVCPPGNAPPTEIFDFWCYYKSTIWSAPTPTNYVCDDLNWTVEQPANFVGNCFGDAAGVAEFANPDLTVGDHDGIRELWEADLYFTNLGWEPLSTPSDRRRECHYRRICVMGNFITAGQCANYSAYCGSGEDCVNCTLECGRVWPLRNNVSGWILQQRRDLQDMSDGLWSLSTSMRKWGL